ncbi:hypothetical protein AMS68_000412 [Peltaster fructicola]|uniref:Uncharacterized protein n=1 Tax=Peltaster fructicola TaxID=286661 RepID=A0A6H0XJU8_9PEZI|nr:hypothetical protein AMS68_000412 [Peltaster fructicola]
MGDFFIASSQIIGTQILMQKHQQDQTETEEATPQRSENALSAYTSDMFITLSYEVKILTVEYYRPAGTTLLTSMAAHYTFADHSGLKNSKTFNNPYDGLLEQCNNDPVEIQAIYQRHRTNRNEQQKDKLLSPDFQGVTIDEILARLENPKEHSESWRLSYQASVAHEQRTWLTWSGLWALPSQSLHMTTLEVTHSRTAPEIEELVKMLLPHVTEIANYTQTHRARLVKPLLSFDAQAFALSFLPAAGEPGRTAEEYAYSYHHLRRDIFNKVEAAGLKVGSRYVVPSAHLTIGRYITREDLETGGKLDSEKVKKLTEVIDYVNEWLVEEYSNLEWRVGQERGLTCRKGTLWYGGGGETIYQGDGF